MRREILGALAIMLAAALWGLDGVVLTPRLFNLDVLFVVFLLHAIPFLIMSVFLHKEFKQLKRFGRKDYIVFLLIAVSGGFLGTYGIVKALFLVNFQALSIVVLLQKLQPIFVIVLAAILLKEKIGKSFAVWATVAIISSYFLAFGFTLPQLTDNMFLASMWAVVAAASFGASTVFSKMALKKFKFYTANFYRFGITSVLMLIIVLIAGKIEFASVTPTNWLIFIIIALTTGSGAIFIYYYGLSRVRAMVSTICELMFPLSAIVFDFFINGKLLSPIQWLFAGIMLFAIIQVSKTRGKKK